MTTMFGLFLSLFVGQLAPASQPINLNDVRDPHQMVAQLAPVITLPNGGHLLRDGNSFTLIDEDGYPSWRATLTINGHPTIGEDPTFTLVVVLGDIVQRIDGTLTIRDGAWTFFDTTTGKGVRLTKLFTYPTNDQRQAPTHTVADPSWFDCRCSHAGGACTQSDCDTARDCAGAIGHCGNYAASGNPFPLIAGWLLAFGIGYWVPRRLKVVR